MVCVVQAADEGIDCLAYLNSIILPAVARSGFEVQCCCGDATDLSNLKKHMEELQKLVKWSMILGNDRAICQADVERVNKRELPYPSSLESRCSRAIVSAKGEEVRKQFKLWTAEFTCAKHNPLHTIEYCNRFISYMLRLAGDLHGFKLPEPLQNDWQAASRCTDSEGINQIHG